LKKNGGKRKPRWRTTGLRNLKNSEKRRILHIARNIRTNARVSGDRCVKNMRKALNIRARSLNINLRYGKPDTVRALSFIAELSIFSSRSMVGYYYLER
jgi:hypothetical protein